MEVLFILVFLAVFGVAIFTIVKSVMQWNKNNGSPRLSVSATAVTKRRDETHHTHSTGDATFSTPSTTYYVTFEVESGDRLEFRVSGKEYGLICEGDCGKLTFQGTRFISFDRDRSLL